MAEIKIHPNDPRPVQFECPDCGKRCLCTPLFYADGGARGVRHGHGVQHEYPLCRTYQTMTTLDFMKLAIAEVPVLNKDPHVSVKEPEAPPLIISDGGASARHAALLDGAQGKTLELEQHERDVRAFETEARELAAKRDVLRAAREKSQRAAWLRRVGASAAVVGAAAVLTLVLHSSPSAVLVFGVLILWKIWA